MVQAGLIWLAGLVVGGLGSMLGIGGGLMLIPMLTGVFGVGIKAAIGASIVCVIATSSSAGAVYVERGLTHSRLAMVLEVATTAGALAGGITAAFANPRLLSFLFALLLIYATYSMRRFKSHEVQNRITGLLDTSFTDPNTGREVNYGVSRLPLGLGASFLAGNLSGLLGIGGGIVKVPIMTLAMGVPIRAAIATSNFMIGVTAATSAVIYYQHGYINPNITVPAVLGVLLGARGGSLMAGRLNSDRLRQIFQVVLIVFAVQMIVQSFRR